MGWLFALGGQSTGTSASASVLPMNSQSWFPLELAGWISLLSKGTSRVFSNTTVQRHQFCGTQTSLWPKLYIYTWLLEKPYLWLHRSLLAKSCLIFNMLSRFVIAFLPRSKSLLISWLRSQSAVILEPKKINSNTVSIVPPSICHVVMGPDAMILDFFFWS